MTIERPMFPPRENETYEPVDPTRRRFLSTAAGIAAGGTALALAVVPANAVSVSSPTLTEPPDRHVLESYGAWLHMERRLLCRELYPHMCKDAERFIFADNAGFDWHFCGRGDLEWDQGPQPSSRAVAVLDLAGVDWRRRQPNHPDLYAVDNGDRPPLPANWPQVDGELRQAFDDIVEMDAAIATLHKQHGDDADSRDDYLECQDMRDDAIATLIDVRASSTAGIMAKASALQLKVLFEDYERHQEIALSLADDLIALGSVEGGSHA
jgi:hypothetical protein